MRFLIAALCLTLFLPALDAPALAGSYKGVEVPDTKTINGETVTLNGMGLRSKFFISVYVGALYLATPTSDATALVEVDEAKSIEMHFLRDVGADAIVEAFQEGFTKNTPDMDPELGARVKTFLAAFDREVKEGETILLDYTPTGGTVITFGGKEVVIVAGADFMRAAWRIWFGAHPADGDLMEGMLGK